MASDCGLNATVVVNAAICPKQGSISKLVVLVVNVERSLRRLARAKIGLVLDFDEKPWSNSRANGYRVRAMIALNWLDVGCTSQLSCLSSIAFAGVSYKYQVEPKFIQVLALFGTRLLMLLQLNG